MKNIGKYFLPILIISLLLTGCGDKGKTSEINMDELANDLLEADVFDEELTEVDKDTIANLYSIDNFEEGKVYISNGATGDEIAILKVKDKEQAEEIKSAFEDRIQEQIDVFESYAPEEVNKLENAILEVQGNYIIMVVSAKEEAQEIVTNHLK